MVRFIIETTFIIYLFQINVYIPIWLDLLFIFINYMYQSKIGLHSNMVRFIILEEAIIELHFKMFTFQYG